MSFDQHRYEIEEIGWKITIIKWRKYMFFKTIIGIQKGETENVRKVCEDIKRRDSSFQYEIYEPSVKKLREKFENLLILLFSTEIEAKRWGGWFIHLCREAKIGDYFWIKKSD